jgi:hypothetical protein
MVKRAKRGKQPRRKSQPVVFTDAALVKVSTRPPFRNQKGNYAEPDIIIAGGAVPPGVPRQIDCETHVVIYSSWAEFVPSCKGYGGPGDGGNPIVQRALANAEAVAKRIKCKGDCIKRVVQLWSGWDCGPEGRKFLALGAVELVVVCQTEY